MTLEDAYLIADMLARCGRAVPAAAWVTEMIEEVEVAALEGIALMPGGVQFEWRGDVVVREIHADMVSRVGRLADEFQAECERQCPVDTGNLKATHHQEEGRNDLEIFVVAGGPTVLYADYVHNGTRRHRPNPWMDRALATVAGKAKAILGAE